jgi:UDP-2,4-diacetamido-2,4,6-trideoxy-beta-L-altropyranose hydrolase
MKKKLIFRADGNSTTGLGHLYRLFALVEMYKATFDFVFVTKENTITQKIHKEYPLELIPESIKINEEPKWLAHKFSVSNHIIIADGYQFISSYQRNIKNKGFKLMYIDDLTTEYMYADIVVNHSPMIEKSMFQSENYTKYALGTKYAILRPAFLKETKVDESITNLSTAFVCFGGADSTNLTLKAVDALLKIKEVKEINVVVGAAYNDKELIELSKKNPCIYVYKNLEENQLVQLMRKSNLSIASSSTILYELCSVNSLILTGFYVDNQERIYNGFLKNDAIIGLGNILNFTSRDFQLKIEKSLKENVSDYISAQQKMFDSTIKDRFLKLITKLC